MDIGCGVGDLLYVAQQNNFRNVVGLELSNSSREFSKEHYGLDLISSTIHDYASSNEQNNFDVISLIGLLEHVTDPDSTLKSAISLSHPETFFLIQVPNWDSLATKLQCFFPNNVYRHASPLEHIQLFTEQSINTLLANNGLEINSIWWHGLDIHQLLIELEFLSDGFMESEAAKLLLLYLTSSKNLLIVHDNPIGFFWLLRNQDITDLCQILFCP